MFSRWFLSIHFVLLLASGIARADEAAAPVAAPVAAPQRIEFTVDGRPAFVILPPKATHRPTPWVLYAPTLGKGLPGDAEKWMFERFLAAGIAIAGVDVGESYGSPKGRATYSALHRELVEKRGFDSQANLLARSRGGLMLYAWAADNPQKVRSIAGIYPVCNIASYPGLAKACGAYGMTEAELRAKLSEHNPIDRLEPLARAKVPIFHIHGDDDKVVPLKDNSALVAERYKALGGRMELVVPKGQGHNMWEGFFQCRELVAFVIANAAGDSLPKPIAHWTFDDTAEKALDSAGEHHGVIHGAKAVDGKIGKALLFDRSKAQYVEVSYSKNLDIKTFTVAAWVKLTKPPTFSGIVGTRFGGEFTFDMKVNADKVHGDIGDGKRWIETKVNFYENDTGSDGQGGKLKLDRWYHIAFVIDGGEHKCRLYLDGDRKATIAYEGDARLMTPEQTLRIGHSSGTEHMDGVIDDVRIWNAALTEEQVKLLIKSP